MTPFDPSACARVMAEAMEQFDFATAREHARSLEAAFTAGELPADWSADQLAETVRRVLARTVYPD